MCCGIWAPWFSCTLGIGHPGWGTHRAPQWELGVGQLGIGYLGHHVPLVTVHPGRRAAQCYVLWAWCALRFLHRGGLGLLHWAPWASCALRFLHHGHWAPWALCAVGFVHTVHIVCPGHQAYQTSHSLSFMHPGHGKPWAPSPWASCALCHAPWALHTMGTAHHGHCTPWAVGISCTLSPGPGVPSVLLTPRTVWVALGHLGSPEWGCWVTGGAVGGCWGSLRPMRCTGVTGPLPLSRCWDHWEQSGGTGVTRRSRDG